MNAISPRCACPLIGRNGAPRLYASLSTNALTWSNRTPRSTASRLSVASHDEVKSLITIDSLSLCHLRSASSSSSTRWKSRQTNDAFAREAKVAGLKSRAAFKLLEIHAKYRIFKRGDTVVDLGFAPGSWSQVAVSKTQPGGRVVGIDVIPAQPPRGANALQGNFLSPEIRERMREFVGDRNRGRVGGGSGVLQQHVDDGEKTEDPMETSTPEDILAAAEVHKESQVIEEQDVVGEEDQAEESVREAKPNEAEDITLGRVVDVVLSDMMMNTSGIAFRDHAGSMDLCTAALDFCYSSLATDGHFLTKFYTGAEDQVFEKRLRRLFHKVHRIKPESSRKESKEAYFLALRRKPNVPKEDVFGDIV